MLGRKHVVLIATTFFLLGILITSGVFNFVLKDYKTKTELEIKDVINRTIMNQLDLCESRITSGEPELEEFMRIAKNFSKQHNYTDDYQCVNYSKDLLIELENLSIPIYEVWGCKNFTHSEHCHSWLRVGYTRDFNPQTGKFKDFSKEYPVYWKEYR